MGNDRWDFVALHRFEERVSDDISDWVLGDHHFEGIEDICGLL